jgi:hypothetical protein
MDRAAALGGAAAVGSLIKVQPGLLVIWAVAAGRWRAAAVAAGVATALAGVSTLFTGPAAWATYADLLRNLGGTLGTPHNFAPGAVAVQAGVSDAAAATIQLGTAALAVVALLAAWRWASPVIGFQVTIVASQLISSPLRDHYAVLLLLPTALLLERGRSWAVVLPLAGWLALFAFPSGGGSVWTAAATVPLAMFGCLAVLLWEARRDARPSNTARMPAP